MLCVSFYRETGKLNAAEISLPSPPSSTENEVEMSCPSKPEPEENFKPLNNNNNEKEKETPDIRPFKRLTRTACGVKLKKPTKDLTTYTEAAAAAAAATPEMPKLKLGKKVPLNDALRWCLEFVKELFTKQHAEYAWPFYKPVDLKQFPDYLRYIKSPIDLTTIKNLIQTGGFETVGRFATAMRLMFSNCIRYNPPESPIIEQARKLRDLFELRFANIPEEYLKMKLELPSRSSSSSGKNVSPPSTSTPSSSKSAPPPSSRSTPSSSKKEKEERSHHAPPPAPSRSKKSSKINQLQLQINTLTLALKTALQGGGAAQEAKKLLNLVSQATPGVTPELPKGAKRGPKSNSKRGPKPKKSRQRHLSSSESDSDDEAPLFHPTKMEDLQKLKDDLENLPASDVHSLFSILRETEPSLRVDDTNIEIDFQTLSSHTLIKLRKYVDSAKLNMVKARSSGHVPSHIKRFCNTPTDVRPPPPQPNIINDCDNNLSRAGSRASNLQLSEDSSSDSEIDD